MLVMFPCGSCSRHLRDSETSCPFCGAQQRLAPSSVRPHIGAFALVAALLGSAACASNPSGDGQTTTTNTTTSDTTTDVSTSTDDTEVTTGDDTITDTQNTSGSFYAGPDIDFININECDPWVQDCPEGEKCVPKADSGPWWDANACVSILGDGGVGDPCTYGGPVDATDDCGPESVCWNSQGGGDGAGTCMPYCTGTPDDPICELEGTACMISNEGSINLCLQTCNPLDVDACPAGEACAWVRSGFFCNVPLAPGMQGDSCEYEPMDCSSGLQCLDAEVIPGCASEKCCTSMCDVTAQPDPCVDVGLECVVFFDEAPPGLEDVGVCIAPAP